MRNKDLRILMEQDLGDNQDLFDVADKDFYNISNNLSEEFGNLQNYIISHQDFTEFGLNERVYYIAVSFDDRDDEMWREPNDPLFEVHMYRYFVNEQGVITREKTVITDRQLHGQREQLSRGVTSTPLNENINQPVQVSALSKKKDQRTYQDNQKKKRR